MPTKTTSVDEPVEAKSDKTKLVTILGMPMSLNVKLMSINRIAIWIFLLGYLWVNVRMQLIFFSGPPSAEQNIWSKYQMATSTVDALRIGQDAYYSKTGWILILLILQALRMPFGLALGLSTVCYAVTMAAFFGFDASTIIYSIAALALLVSYFAKRPQDTTKPLPIT
jgi:hypothetical protein